MKLIRDSNINFCNLNMNQMRFDRMKTERQMTRNFAMTKAKELIKAHFRYNGKPIQVEWLIQNSKDRGVRWDNQLVFTQSARDTIGTFADPFSDLVIE